MLILLLREVISLTLALKRAVDKAVDEVSGLALLFVEGEAKKLPFPWSVHSTLVFVDFQA